VSARAPVILGPNGKPVERRVRALGYDAAGYGRRARDWYAPYDDINSLAVASVETLRARSRHATRQAIGDTAKKRFVSNLVGTGVIPMPKAKDRDFRKAVRELWDTSADELDADGISDHYGQQALAAGQMFEAGEVFARFRPRRLEDGLAVPLKIQLLEADFLRHAMNEDLGNGRKIRQGIEFDPLGRRVAYHFYRDHPGDRFAAGGIETTRVPAQEVVQVFEPIRPGQLRGIPFLAPALTKLYTLDRVSDARAERERVASLFAFFFESDRDPVGDDDPEDDDQRITSIDPGSGYALLPGEKLSFPTLPTTGNYQDFLRPHMREVAGPSDLSYEQLSGDMTQVNYSSARVALLELRRRIEHLQFKVLRFQLLRRVWARWFMDAVISGALEVPDEFFTSTAMRADLMRVKWMPQGFQWVDPEKEAKAANLMVRGGFKSRSMIVAELGYDAEEIDEENAADREREERLGLVYDSNPSHDKDGAARASALLPSGGQQGSGDAASSEGGEGGAAGEGADASAAA
jgi:lambda family phage portal protein